MRIFSRAYVSVLVQIVVSVFAFVYVCVFVCVFCVYVKGDGCVCERETSREKQQLREEGGGEGGRERDSSGKGEGCRSLYQGRKYL